MPLDPNWDPDVARRSLTDDLEKAVYDGESQAETAKRLLKEAAPLAAAQLVHQALNSPNERIRLQASQYIIDRNLGRVGDSGPIGDTESDPLQVLIKDIVRNVPGIVV